MSFQRLFPTFPIPHFGHAVALAKVVAYALTKIKSGLLDGTISVWQKNEGAGTLVDDPVGANDGTIYGALWTTDAKSGGYALSFDNIDDYVRVPHSTSLNVVTEYTIEAWIKAIQDRTKWHAIVEKDDEVSYGWEFQIQGGDGPTPGALSHYLRNRPYDYARPTIVVDDGVWHHVAIVITSTTMTYYVDGISETLSIEVWNNDNTDDLHIGYDPDEAARAFNGIIDDVRFYNRALTASEISERYNYGFKIRITGMTEGQKAELYDVADVLKASYTLGVGETEAVLNVAALTFPFEGYFKIYDVDGVTLLLKTGTYTDIWGGDIYKFQVL